MNGLMAVGIGLVVGVVLGLAGYWLRLRALGQTLRGQADEILNAARVERDGLLDAAERERQDELREVRAEHEQEVAKRREEIDAREKRLLQRETNVERKNELVDRRERELRQRESDVIGEKRRALDVVAEAEQQLKEAGSELERVASMSSEEARQRVIDAVRDEAQKQAVAQTRRIEEEARREASQRAAKIVAGAIQRLAGEFVSEKTVSVVELPSDDMKGRIIGREGRNIRAIEAATGVDVIIDDTPEVVVLSAFNPVRREVARQAMERLITDGRVHPARIEEVVEKVTEEMEETLQRHGEQATFDLGLHGLHPELIKLVGSLKYRLVNGQNIWNHACETAAIAGMMAAELNLNPQVAKRAGLLHDIGKAVEHEVEGDHATVGAEQARRFGERPEVVEAIQQHHDEKPATVMGVLVQAADTLSKARPGARRDLLDSYIRRLDALERTAKSFRGVEQAYAIQSGREVRVMVNYEEVSNDDALTLSGDIARRIEDELTYPGEVRVTVIREARATELAK